MASKVKCAHCNTYVLKTTAIRTNVQSFCSNDHLYEYHHGAQQRSSVKSDIPIKVRQAVYDLDGAKCRYCGINRNLEIHHINYRSEQGAHDIENLITLCMEHHQLMHSNKKKYQPMCQEFLKKRAKGDKFALIFIQDHQHTLTTVLRSTQ